MSKVKESVQAAVEGANEYARERTSGLRMLANHPKMRALEGALEGQVVDVNPGYEQEPRGFTLVVERDSEVPRRLAKAGFPLVKEVVPSVGLVLRHKEEGSIELTVYGYVTPGCKLVATEKVVKVKEWAMECGEGEGRDG